MNVNGERRQSLPFALIIAGIAGAVILALFGRASSRAHVTYDATILADKPVLYLADGTTKDRGRGHHSVSKVGGVTTVSLPNGDKAWRFDSSGKEYIKVKDPANGDLSINKTGALTVEVWMQVSNTNQPHPGHGLAGGVNALGKSLDSDKGCEYQFRYYGKNSSDPGNGQNATSFYALNPNCGYGAGYDAHLVRNTTEWIYWVGIYSTSGKGLVGIGGGVYGIPYNGRIRNSTTMNDSVYGRKIVPRHTKTPFTVGACGIGGGSSFFFGKIGKVAIYDRVLSASEISAHFAAMQGS